MPKFFIRRIQHMKPTGAAGVEQPHLIVWSLDPSSNDGSKQTFKWENSLGLKEYLLCADCEEQFSGYESYAREVLYGRTSQLTKIAVGNYVAMHNPPLLGVRVVPAGAIDYKKFKLYQLSLIWRASVASGSHFRNIDLGPHEEPIRIMLTTENPGDEGEYCCAMTDIRYLGKGCEDFSTTPTLDEEAPVNQPAFKIIFGGYIYVFNAGTKPPSNEVFAMAIKRSGSWHIPVGEATSLIRGWADALKAIGKL